MPDDFRVCASCARRVSKRDVHKNRYSQYICRECHSSGVKAVGAKSIRYYVSRVPMLALALVATLLVVLLLVAATLVAGSLHSYSNGNMVQDLKDALRSLNQLAH